MVTHHHTDGTRQAGRNIKKSRVFACRPSNHDDKRNSIVGGCLKIRIAAMEKATILTILLSSEYGPFQHGMYKILSWLPFFYFFSMRETLFPEQSIYYFKNEAKDCFLQTERLIVLVTVHQNLCLRILPISLKAALARPVALSILGALSCGTFCIIAFQDGCTRSFFELRIRLEFVLEFLCSCFVLLEREG